MAEQRVPGTSVAALTRVAGFRIAAAADLRLAEARELCELYLSLRDGPSPRWLDRVTVVGSLGLGVGSAWSLVTQDPAIVVTSLLAMGSFAAAGRLFERRRPLLQRFTEMGVDPGEHEALLLSLERVTSDRSLSHLVEEERVHEMSRRLVAGQ